MKNMDKTSGLPLRAQLSHALIEPLEDRRLLSGTAVPNGPFALTATATSPTVVALTFYDNSDNEEGFVIQRSSAGGPFATVATSSPFAGTGGPRAYNDATAVPGATYSYRVFAVNGIFQSSIAGPVDVTTPAGGDPFGVPNGPFGLTAAATSLGVTLTFYDNSFNEQKFVIERGNSAAGPFTPVGSTGPFPGTGGPQSFVDSTAVPNTIYFYRVYAVNGIYTSSIAGPVSVTTIDSGGVPNGPFGLSAKAGGEGVVTLTFYDNANNEQNFVVERSVGNGPWTQAGTPPASPGTGAQVTFTDVNAPVGVVASYRVYAVNGIYHSSFAGPTQVTTTTPPGSIRQPDGKLLVPGSLILLFPRGTPGVHRYLVDGSLDNSFGTAGNAPAYDHIDALYSTTKLHMMPNGNILAEVLGISPTSQQLVTFGLGLINPSGVLLKSIPVAFGSAQNGLPKTGDVVDSVTVDPNTGVITVTGHSLDNQSTFVKRYNADLTAI